MQIIKSIKDNKLVLFLVVIFILITLINIIYSSYSSVSVGMDGGFCFVNIMHKIGLSNDFGFSLCEDTRTRVTINFLNQLPLNIAYIVFHIHNKNVLTFIFSLPLFLYPVIVTFYNFYLAKRTERYDIAILGLILYCLFVLPTQVWPIVESMLAMPIILLLFHYLCAEIDYKRYDNIIIAIICIISLWSTEAMVYCGPLLFIFSLYYAKKQKNLKNKITKYLIGISSLLTSILMLIYSFLTKDNAASETLRFFNEFYWKDWSHFYKEQILILIISLLSIFILSFKKEKMKNAMLLTIYVLWGILSIYIAYNIDLFWRILDTRADRVLLFIVIPILIILGGQRDISLKMYDNIYTGIMISSVILYCAINDNIMFFYFIIPFLIILGVIRFLYYIKINQQRYENIYFNIMIIVLICGILNTSLSIYRAYRMIKVKDSINITIEKVDDTIVEFNKLVELDPKIADFKEFVDPDLFAYGYLMLSNKKNIDKILVEKPEDTKISKDKILFIYTEVTPKTYIWNIKLKPNNK